MRLARFRIKSFRCFREHKIPLDAYWFRGAENGSERSTFMMAFNVVFRKTKTQQKIAKMTIGILACSAILSMGCASYYFTENPATLINWQQNRIDNKTHLALKPSQSFVMYTDCTIGILQKPNNSPIDLAYPRFLLPSDLAQFNSIFPQFNVSAFFSSRENLASIQSAYNALILHGNQSETYKLKLKYDAENIRAVDLPLTPGAPSIHTFSGFLSEVTRRVKEIRPALRNSGVAFKLDAGTGSMIGHNGRISLVTAAHVVSMDLKGAQDRDLAVLSYPALDMGNIAPSELYVSSLHPTVNSADLMGKPLQIYFSRTACPTGEEWSVASVIYDLTPTVYDEERDELYANVPSDFGDYMGAVSGAGVYLDGKIVEVFVGRRCAEGLPDNNCSSARGTTAHLRFVGIDSLRVALNISVEAGPEFPLISY